MTDVPVCRVSRRSKVQFIDCRDVIPYCLITTAVDVLVQGCLTTVNLTLTNLSHCRIYASVNRVSTGSDNGLVPNISLSIGPLGTDFNEILIKIQNIAFKKMHLKILPVKWAEILSRGNELLNRVRVWMSSYIPCNYGNISLVTVTYFGIETDIFIIGPSHL